MTQKENLWRFSEQQEEEFLKRLSLKKFTVPKDKLMRQTDSNYQSNDNVLDCSYQQKYRIEYRDLKRSLTGTIPWWLRSKGLEGDICTEHLVTLVKKSVHKIISSKCQLSKEIEHKAKGTCHSNGFQDSPMIEDFLNISMSCKTHNVYDNLKEIEFIERRICRVVRVLNNFGDARLGSGCEKCNKNHRAQELLGSVAENHQATYDLQHIDQEIDSICHCLETLMKENCQCSIFGGIIQKLQNIRSSLNDIKENELDATQNFVCPKEILEKMAKFLGYESSFPPKEEISSKNKKSCKAICPCYQMKSVGPDPLDSVLREKNTQRERLDEVVQKETKNSYKRVQSDYDSSVQQRFKGPASKKYSLENKMGNEINEVIVLQEPRPNKFIISETEVDSEDEKFERKSKINRTSLPYYASQRKNSALANKDETTEDETYDDTKSQDRNGHIEYSKNYRTKNERNLEETRNGKTKSRNDADNEQRDSTKQERCSYHEEKEYSKIFEYECEECKRKAEEYIKNLKLERQSGKGVKDPSQIRKTNFAMFELLETETDETDRHQRQTECTESMRAKHNPSMHFAQRNKCRECTQKSLTFPENKNQFSENGKHCSKHEKNHQQQQQSQPQQRKYETNDIAKRRQNENPIDEKEVSHNTRYTKHRQNSENGVENRGASRNRYCDEGIRTIRTKSVVNAHQDRDEIYRDRRADVKSNNKYSNSSSSKPSKLIPEDKVCAYLQNEKKHNHVSDKRNNNFREQQSTKVFETAFEISNQNNIKSDAERAQYHGRKTTRDGKENNDKLRNTPNDQNNRNNFSHRDNMLHPNTNGEAGQKSKTDWKNKSIPKHEQISGTSTRSPISPRPQRPSDCCKSNVFSETHRADVKDPQYQDKQYRNSDSKPQGGSETNKSHRHRQQDQQSYSSSQKPSQRYDQEMSYQHYHRNHSIQRNNKPQNLRKATAIDESNKELCKPNREQGEGRQKSFKVTEAVKGIKCDSGIRRYTTKTTLSKSICENCFGQSVPVVSENLAKEMRSIIGQRERNSVFVKFTACYNNLYHMQMSTDNEYLGCLYATESATFQAMDYNDFDGYVTLSVTETSNTLSQIQQLVDHAFVVVQLEKKRE